MNIKTVASTMFLLTCTAFFNASSSKNIFPKMVHAGKVVALGTAIAGWAEIIGCSFRANGDPELSRQLVAADIMALTYNVGKFTETALGVVFESKKARQQRILDESDKN